MEPKKMNNLLISVCLILIVLVGFISSKNNEIVYIDNTKEIDSLINVLETKDKEYIDSLIILNIRDSILRIKLDSVIEADRKDDEEFKRIIASIKNINDPVELELYMKQEFNTYKE